MRHLKEVGKDSPDTSVREFRCDCGRCYQVTSILDGDARDVRDRSIRIEVSTLHGYQTARGCAPSKTGLSAEEAIAKGRGGGPLRQPSPKVAVPQAGNKCPECGEDRATLQAEMGVWLGGDVYITARNAIIACPACREWWLHGGKVTQAQAEATAGCDNPSGAQEQEET